jgi:putative ABC transport system ATP-binding protein
LDNLLVSPYAASKRKAREIAHRLNIEDFLHRYPNQLSVGQQQRATIARAVMNGPKLILADEPTSALDNKNCLKVIDLLLEEAKTNDAALIIVTHDDRLRSEISNCIELKAISN